MLAGFFEYGQPAPHFQASLDAAAHVGGNVALDEVGIDAIAGQLVAHLQGDGAHAAGAFIEQGHGLVGAGEGGFNGLRFAGGGGSQGFAPAFFCGVQNVLGGVVGVVFHGDLCSVLGLRGTRSKRGQLWV